MRPVPTDRPFIAENQAAMDTMMTNAARGGTPPLRRSTLIRKKAMMMDMSAAPTGMLVVAGIYHLVVFIFAALGIAASIKYLRS